MVCHKCGKQTSACGCHDTPLTTAPTDYSSTCPEPQVCSEFTYSGCIIYNGPPIPIMGLVPGMTLNEVLQNIINTGGCVSTITTPTCLSTTLSIIKITSTSIDIGWEEVSYATGYIISYDDGSGAQTISVGPSITHKIITGLDPDTDYDITVSVTCVVGGPCESVLIRVKTSE